MKKRRIIAGIFIYLVFFCVTGVNAQTDCRFGLENDPAPGRCGSYVDVDENNLCDLSETHISNMKKVENVSQVLSGSVSKEKVELGPRYKFLPITVTLIILYLITYILVKEKKITLLTHRRIWNTVLLFSFLASLTLGILLIMRINQGWNFNLPFNMLYWHVELGTVMAVVTLFHLTWHWRYYTCMLKRKKKEECAD